MHTYNFSMRVPFFIHIGIFETKCLNPNYFFFRAHISYNNFSPSEWLTCDSHNNDIR